MALPKQLFLNIMRDEQRRVWGVARICLSDGSCLVIESRIFREWGVQGRDYAAGEEEAPKNQALDDALNKLCYLTSKPGIKQAIPLPARIALKAVCKARNLQKIKRAIEKDPDVEEEVDASEEEVGAEMKRMRCGSEIERRAMGALRLWA